MTDFDAEADALYDLIGTHVFREEFRTIYAKLRSNPSRQWEYTVGNVDRRIPYISEETYGSAEEAQKSLWPGAVVLRRRPASEWEVADGAVPVAG